MTKILLMSGNLQNILPHRRKEGSQGLRVMHISAWWRCVESGDVSSPPLPSAGAPAKPQSRRRYFAVPDHTGGAHPTTSGLVVAAIARCWRSH